MSDYNILLCIVVFADFLFVCLQSDLFYLVNGRMPNAREVCGHVIVVWRARQKRRFMSQCHHPLVGTWYGLVVKESMVCPLAITRCNRRFGSQGMLSRTIYPIGSATPGRRKAGNACS